MPDRLSVETVGATMAAAVSVVRAAGARDVTVAVPVGAAQAVEWMHRCADDVLCPCLSQSSIAVEHHDEQSDQAGDPQVIALLRQR